MSNTSDQNNDSNLKSSSNTEKLNSTSMTEKSAISGVPQTPAGKLGRGLGRLIPIKNSQDNAVKPGVSDIGQNVSVTRVTIQPSLSKILWSPKQAQ